MVDTKPGDGRLGPDAEGERPLIVKTCGSAGLRYVSETSQELIPPTPLETVSILLGSPKI